LRWRDHSTNHAVDAGKVGKAFVAMGALVSVPIIASTKVIGDFQEQMAKVSTMLDTETMPMMAKFKQQIRNMSVEFGEGTKTLADGLYDVLSASIPAEHAMDVLNVAVKAARGGMTDTKTAADAITTVSNSFSLSADKAGSVADLLFSIVKKGKVEFPELASSIGMVTSLASNAGISMEEMGASIATMTRSGVKSRRAVFALSGVISNFLKPQSESVELAKKYGVELSQASLQSEGLVKILGKLKNATPEDLAKIFPDKRALKGLLPLIANYSSFVDDVGVMTNRAGRSQEAFDKMTKQLNFKIDKLKQSFIEIWRTLGEQLLPVTTKIIDKLNKFAKVTRDVIENNGEAIRGFVKLIGTLALIGIAILGILATVKLLAIAFSPAGFIGLAIIAIVGLVDHFTKADLGFKQFVQNIRVGGLKIGTWLTTAFLSAQIAWLKVKSVFIGGWEAMKVHTLNAVNSMSNFFNKLINQVQEGFWLMVTKALEWAKTLANAFKHIVPDKYKTVLDLVTKGAENKFKKVVIGNKKIEDDADKKAEADRVARAKKFLADTIARQKKLKEKLDGLKGAIKDLVGEDIGEQSDAILKKMQDRFNKMKQGVSGFGDMGDINLPDVKKETKGSVIGTFSGRLAGRLQGDKIQSRQLAVQEQMAEGINTIATNTQNMTARFA